MRRFVSPVQGNRPAGCLASGFIVVFVVMWCGMTGAAMVFVLRSLWQQCEARWLYAETRGTVVSSQVIEHPGDGDSGPSYEPAIAYEYRAGGDARAGSRYWYGSKTFSHRIAAGIVASFPAGGEAAVYYDPRRPSYAVLNRAVTGDQVFPLLFLQPFLIVAIGIVVGLAAAVRARRETRAFLAGTPRPPCRIPGWGVLARHARGWVLAPPVPRLATWGAFAAGAGLVAFLSIFVFVLLYAQSSKRPLWPVGVVGLFAVFAGLKGAAIARRKFGTRAVLTVDTGERRLRVDSTRRHVAVPFHDIAAWVLRDMVDPRPRANRGEGVSKVIVLYARQQDGSEEPLHLFRAADESTELARRAAALLAEVSCHAPLVQESAPPPADGLRGILGDVARPQNLADGVRLLGTLWKNRGALAAAAQAAKREQEAACHADPRGFDDLG